MTEAGARAVALLEELVAIPSVTGDEARVMDFLAARLVEDLAERRITVQVDGEALERLLDRRVAVVRDGADDAAVQVLHDHRLEQIVDVQHWERQVDARVALDRAFALEVADAAAE